MQHAAVLVVFLLGVGMFLIVAALFPVKGKSSDPRFAHANVGIAIHRPVLFACGIVTVGAALLTKGIVGLISM
jgi:hypothetical protein